MAVLRIATRSSAQARTQAEAVAAQIERQTADTTVELVFVETQGDKNTSTPLHQMGGQGIFVKEVQRAVIEGRADLAVHSAKDLPSGHADGLLIGAFTQRRTPNDALIGASLSTLAHGATVATGSVRRRAQLTRVRPDLKFVELRGNIQTRLSKIPDGGAIVMAVAALEILGLTDQIAEVLDIDTAVPMVGQGCVAVEARADDLQTLEVLAGIDHAPTRRAIETERAFLAELGGGCSLPVAAHLDASDVLRCFMANESGQFVQIVGEIGHGDDHLMVGTAAAVSCRQQLNAGGAASS
jgi:hydroxymethylbilane synthase